MLIIRVGIAAADYEPAVELCVDEHPSEFEPDVVWMALNRRDRADVDAAANEALYPGNGPFMMALREALDTAQAPSMSVGDTITIRSASGVDLITYECDSFGWSTTRHDRIAQ